MRLKELRQKRSRMISDLRELSNNPTGDGGDLSEDQQKRFTDLQTELEAVESQINRAEYLEEAERRMTGQSVTGSRDSYETERGNFSLVNLIRSQLQGVQVDTGRELEISQEIARRTGKNPEGVYVPYEIFHRQISQREAERRNVATTGSGGNLVFTDHRGDLYIDQLRDALVIGRAGAMTLTGLSGNVDIPKGTSGATVQWIGEDAEVSKTDPVFTKLQMTPKTAACLTEVTRNMVMQSSPQIEQLVRDQMAADIAVEIDRVALRGGGSGEPSGILATAGTNSIDFSEGMSWGGLLMMIEALENSREFDGNAFVMSATLKRILRNTSKVSGTDSRMIMENAGLLADYPAFTSRLVDEEGSPWDTGLIFGNFRKLMVGIWGTGFDFLINPYETTSFKKGNIQLRAMMSVDVGIRTPQSFCIGLGIPEIADPN